MIDKSSEQFKVFHFVRCTVVKISMIFDSVLRVTADLAISNRSSPCRDGLHGYLGSGDAAKALVSIATSGGAAIDRT